MTLALSFCAGPAALAGIAPPMPAPKAPPAPALAPAPAPPAPALAPPPAAAAVAAPLAPGHVWLALARRALQHERYEEALRCFDAAIAHEPRAAIAHLGRASCLWQLGREDEAHEATLVLLDAARGQEETLYHLARICAREGRIAIAVPLLQEAVRAVPRLEETAMNDALFADHPTYLQALGRL